MIATSAAATVPAIPGNGLGFPSFDSTYLSNMEEGIGKIIASHDVQKSLCKMDDGR